jgi:hypothetical protein
MVKTLIISVWCLMHPVHVTLTSIDFVHDPAGFSVFIRLYLDDFLSDNKLIGNVLSVEDFSVVTSEIRNEVENYLGSRLIIKADQKLLTGKIREMKVEENEISMNLDYPVGREPDSVLVRNLIMTDLYPDMSNMVILKVNDFETGVKLTPEITEQTFIIK